MSHTPGPWYVGEVRHAGRYQLVMARGRTRGFVCDVQNPSKDDSDAEREANARLIASAPDLLAALKGLLSDFSDMLSDPDMLKMALEMAEAGQPLDFSDGGPKTVQDARAAIAAAKAEGE